MSNETDSLFRSYDPRYKYGDVFAKNFYRGLINIRLRPFYISEDLPFYHTWIQDEIYLRDVKVDEEQFAAILNSSNSQCLCGLINMKPVFELELYEPMFLPEHIGDITLHDDHIIMQLTIAPQVFSTEEMADYILPSCLQYLSTYKSLTKAFLINSRDNPYYNQLAINGRPVQGLTDKEGKRVYVYNLPLRP